MESQSHKQGLYPKQPQLFTAGTDAWMLFSFTTADQVAELCPTAAVITGASNQVCAAVKTITSPICLRRHSYSANFSPPVEPKYLLLKQQVSRFDQ